MAKKCIECGKKQGWFEISYAGRNAREEGEHTYKERIAELVLPGNPEKDFLCSECASKRKVICSVHGTILDAGFFRNATPTCSKCALERDTKIYKAQQDRLMKITYIKTTQSESFPGFESEHLSVIEASSRMEMTSNDSSLDKCSEDALFKLKEKAMEIGAAGIVNVSSETIKDDVCEWVGGPAGSVIIPRCTIRYSGTAVRFKNAEEVSNEASAP